MGWLDFAIVVVLGAAAVMGYRRGLLRQAVELAGLIAGVLLALYLTGGLVESYAGPASGWRITPPLVFMVIVGVAILAAQVVARVAGEIMQVTFFGWFDRAGGAVAGLAKGALWLSIAITLVLHLDVSPTVNESVSGSKLGPPLSQLLPAAFAVVETYAEDAEVRQPFHSATR